VVAEWCGVKLCSQTWIDILSGHLLSHGSLVSVAVQCASGGGVARGVVLLFDMVAGVCVARTASFVVRDAPLHSALVVGDVVSDFVWVAVFADETSFTVQASHFVEVGKVPEPAVVSTMALPARHVFRCAAVDGSTGVCLVASSALAGGNVDIWSFNCRLLHRCLISHLVLDQDVIRVLKLCDGKAYAVCLKGKMSVFQLSVSTHDLSVETHVEYQSNALRLALLDAEAAAGPGANLRCDLFWNPLVHPVRTAYLSWGNTTIKLSPADEPVDPDDQVNMLNFGAILNGMDREAFVEMLQDAAHDLMLDFRMGHPGDDDEDENDDDDEEEDENYDDREGDENEEQEWCENCGMFH
jgi:hypothetical protein